VSAAGERAKGTATVSPAEIAARRPIKSRLEETPHESRKEFEEDSVDESGLCSISNNRRSLAPRPRGKTALLDRRGTARSVTKKC
jgi:hypothetical protein